MQYLFPALLSIHLIGLSLMAGTAVVEFINYQFFWNLLGRDQQQAAGVLSVTNKTSKMTGLGAALLILSGAGMIAMTHGVMAMQLWFKIKMGVVILLTLNGILNGNKVSSRIRLIAGTQTLKETLELQRLKSN